MWRGSLLPLGCEATLKIELQRSPLGASSLATIIALCRLTGSNTLSILINHKPQL